MTFHLGWQQREVCDSRLPTHSWGIPPVEPGTALNKTGGGGNNNNNNIKKFANMIRCKREQLGVKRLSIKGGKRMHKRSGCSRRRRRRRGGGRADESPEQSQS